MKKIHKITILILIALIILIGILIILFKKKDNNDFIEPDKVIKCALNNNYGNYLLNSNYEIYSKDGIVLYVNAKEEVSSKNKEILDFQSRNIKVMYESSNKLYGGYEIKASDKENAILFEIKIDYTKMDIKRYLDDQIALKNYYKNDGLEENGLKVYYESRGAICKES